MSDEKIISFLKYSGHAKCKASKIQHVGPLVINEDTGMVDCECCGKSLTPIFVLKQMASNESRWNESSRRMREMKKELQARTKTKCEHCKKFTTIRVNGLDLL